MLKKIDFPLKQVNEDDIRYYYSPDLGKFPSVSTVLKTVPEGEGLKIWKEKLVSKGIDPDERLQYTAVRGTTVHYLITKHLADETTQESPPLDFSSDEEQKLFEQLNGTNDFSSEVSRSYLIFVDKFLRDHDLQAANNGLEFKVVSYQHRYAGTVDIFGYLDGKLTLVDIKTSRKIRDKHVLQAWAYRQALFETHDVEVDQVAILAVCPDKNFLGRLVNPDENYQLEIFTEDKLSDFLHYRSLFRMNYGF
ncbi:MAG: hypothetical protein ACXAEU_09430 [Candidatus Hodarchaeales archaeon]|jgi:hypothetical protein